MLFVWWKKVYLWYELCICGTKIVFVGWKVNLWDEKWICGMKSEFLGLTVYFWNERWKVESEFNLYNIIVCVFLWLILCVWWKEVYLWYQLCICVMKSEFVGRWEQYWDSTKEECVSPFHDSIRSFQGEGWGVGGGSKGTDLYYTLKSFWWWW